MRILVTGGAGYVGSTLVPLLLNAGHCVRVLDRLDHGGAPMLGVWSHPAFEFQLGDLREVGMVEKAVDGMDAVVHLAAVVGDPACARQPDLARAVNLVASLALIEQCRRAGVGRFVFASTCSNYGKMRDTSQYVDEDSELLPVSLYAETKVEVERALLESPCSSDWCPTPLRFSTVYGVSPRMRFDLTVNEFTVELMTKKHLKVFGEQFWRPYIHVRDAARAIHLVLESPVSKVAHRVFNVGDTTQNFQKQHLVELVLKHVPDAVVEYVKKHEDPRDYRVSFARIQSELGFRLTMTVPDGIAEIARLVESRIITNFDDPRFKN
jgi:nucleoside-diphosphate-sugar epimerase